MNLEHPHPAHTGGEMLLVPAPGIKCGIVQVRESALGKQAVQRPENVCCRLKLSPEGALHLHVPFKNRGEPGGKQRLHRLTSTGGERLARNRKRDLTQAPVANRRYAAVLSAVVPQNIS